MKNCLPLLISDAKNRSCLSLCTSLSPPLIRELPPTRSGPSEGFLAAGRFMTTPRPSAALYPGLICPATFALYNSHTKQ